MILVTSNLVSANGPDKDRKLGSITISNVGGTNSLGNYHVVLHSAGARSRVVREAYIEKWPRNERTAQALVAMAYAQLFPEAFRWMS